MVKLSENNPLLNKISDKREQSSLVRKMFLSIIFIMILQALMNSVTIMVDGLAIANFVEDQNAMAAFTSGSNAVLLISVLTSILGVGCQVMCSKRLTAGKTEDANKILVTTIVIAFITGLLLTILAWFLSNQVASVLGAKGELNQGAADYIKSYYLAAPFIFLQGILTSIVYLDGDRTLVNCSIFGAVIINVAGDLIGTICFKGGLFAVGLTSALSFVISSLILLIHFFRKKSSFKIRLKYFSLGTIRDVLITGLPVGCKQLMVTLRGVILVYIISYVGGTNSMTIYSVCRNAVTMINSVGAGLSQSVLMLVSVYHGEEDEKSLDELLKIVKLMTLFVQIPIAVLFAFLSPVIINLYADKVTPQIYDETLFALVMTAVQFGVGCLCPCYLSFFQGCKQEKNAYIAAFLISFFLPLTFISLCALPTKNSYGLWIGCTIGYSIYPVVHFIVAFFKNNRKLPLTAKQFFFLPKDFGFEENCKIDFHIKNIQDTVDLSKKVLKFCDEHNIDNKRKNYLASCVEEMGVLIVTSGFTRDKRKHHCSMRILYKKNKLVLRVRDDCKKFNIKEKNDRYYLENDPITNMGIRLVLNNAKDIEYANILSTNNLIITF